MSKLRFQKRVHQVTSWEEGVRGFWKINEYGWDISLDPLLKTTGSAPTPLLICIVPSPFTHFINSSTNHRVTAMETYKLSDMFLFHQNQLSWIFNTIFIGSNSKKDRNNVRSLFSYTLLSLILVNDCIMLFESRYLKIFSGLANLVNITESLSIKIISSL